MTKKKVILKILSKCELRAQRRGLSKMKQIKEKKIRKKLMNIRREIRKKGLYTDKIIGLTEIPYATIKWFLIYHIRGQNESINGIKKKRGNLIGDGQKTTWNPSLIRVNSRIRANIAFYKVAARVKLMMTGEKVRYLCRIYNWNLVHCIFTIF
ncbi:MAG: hypothetical protein K9W44_15155 [Candidatus Lokiarchaeota archaeon]|nr:hypothetical protein [Candidatus Harpocratesius repetitus]